METQIHEMEARLAGDRRWRSPTRISIATAQRAREIAQARQETEERVAWLMKEWEELSLRLSAVAGEER